MKIIIRSATEKSEYRERLQITMGDVCLDFCDGEPEDNSIARGFNDVRKIVNALVVAHATGAMGEGIEIQETTHEWGEID